MLNDLDTQLRTLKKRLKATQPGSQEEREIREQIEALENTDDYVSNDTQILRSSQSPTQSSILTSGQRRRLQQKLDELKGQYDLLSKKIILVSEAYRIETSPSVKFQREKELEQAKTERNEVEREMDEIEKKLGM